MYLWSGNGLIPFLAAALLLMKAVTSGDQDVLWPHVATGEDVRVPAVDLGARCCLNHAAAASATVDLKVEYLPYGQLRAVCRWCAAVSLRILNTSIACQSSSARVGLVGEGVRDSDGAAGEALVLAAVVEVGEEVVADAEAVVRGELGRQPLDAAPHSSSRERRGVTVT